MNPTLGRNFEAMDPLEWLARMADHIPDAGKHRTHFYAYYANRARGSGSDKTAADGAEGTEPEKAKKRCSPSWARLISKVYDADPLTCRKCGGLLKIVAYITDGGLTVVPRLSIHTSCPRCRKPFEIVWRRIVRITDPKGNLLAYGYDGNGDLVEFVDQAGHRTTFDYDARHNLLEIHDPLGNRALRSEYDADGRLVAMIDAQGRRITFSHDVGAREEIVTDARGHVSRFLYDEMGFVQSQERAVTIEGTLVLATSTFVHDRFGNELVRVDPDGVRTETVYDHDKLVEEVVDPDGLALRTSRTYDARGEMLDQTDAAGNRMSFGYDSAGNLTRYTDPVGGDLTVGYDAAGRPALARDALGGQTRALTDASGNLTRRERLDAQGNVLTRHDYTYDAAGNRLSETILRTIRGEPRALTTTYGYDAKNRLVAVTDPLGGVRRTEFDAIGRRNAEIDPLGRRTTFTHDAVGALVRADLPDGTSETIDYDASGNVIRRTDRAGRATTFEYDELGRQVRAVQPDGTSSRTVYSPAGRVPATIDVAGNRTDYDYDGAGRRTRTLRPEVLDATTGSVVRPEIREEYDGLGRPTAVVDARGNRSSFAYEGFNRVTRREYADGTARVQSYDALGRLVEQADEAGRRTRFGYDALDRLVQVTDALGGVSRYAYDEAGHLTAQTDALERITRYVHDERGRLVERRLPGGAMESFAYDAVGNATARTDFDGRRTTFTYDAMNRLTAKTFPDGSRVTFSYAPTGQRSTATDSRGSTAYEYDANNRLRRVVHPGGEALDYEYDSAGRLRAVAAPDTTASYWYDALNRLASVVSTEGTASYAYDAAGNLRRLLAANGVTSDFAYDARNRLTEARHAIGDATLGSFAYEISPTGRRTRVTEGAGSAETYAYDALDRLVAETRAGDDPRSITYEYDAVGNRMRMVRDGVTTTYAYDADDRLLSAGPETYAYDGNGNLLSLSTAAGTATYGWDFEDRLTSVAQASGSTRFTYDADGNRVGRESAGDTLQFLVDTANPTGLPQVLQERETTGGLVASYTYGSDLLATSRNGAARFHHHDGLGSTRVLTDAARAVTDLYGYDAYGNLTSRLGTSANPYLFAGEQLEPRLGFYNLRARNYDPSVGRFLGRDPFPGRVRDPRSRHPYLYAHADPVNLTDPTGRFTLIETGIVEAIQGVLRGLDVAKKAGQACRYTGGAAAFGEVAFLAAAVAGAAVASEGVEALITGLANPAQPNTNVVLPSGSVTVFGFEKKPEPDRGFKSFQWSVSYEPPPYASTVQNGGFSGRGAVVQSFDFGFVRDNLSLSAGASFNMATGAVSLTGAVGTDVPFLEVKRCGLDIFTAKMSVSNQLTFDSNGLGFTAAKVEIGATILQMLDLKFALFPPE